ncbi:MAG: PAS domain S-box protein [Rhodospirillales bacterium]|nr:PAS domain S-box protein [Rhodospirillales bacterium]
MADNEKAKKERLSRTKEELAAELEAMEARMLKAEGAETRRKLAEDALYEFEERYRHLIGGSIQGIYVHREWKVLFANQAFAGILGYSSVKELMALDSIVPTFAPYEVDRLKVFRDARKRGGRAPSQYEYDAIRKDGSIVTVLNIARMVKWEGEQAIQCAIIDISDRKQAEQRVLDEKERAENYLNIAGTMIVALSAQGTVTLVNRKGREILGYELIELIGKNWLETVIPEDVRQEKTEDFQRLIAGEAGNVVMHEGGVLTKRGDLRLIDWHVTLVRDATGKITGSLSSGEDISERELATREREQLQTQLRQAEKLKTIGTLAGGIAHDFNNILTPIIGYSHMALGEVAEGSQAYSDIERVVKGANRAKDLVKQILTFSRRGELEMLPMEMQKVVEDALKLIEASSPANVEIHPEIDPNCPPIMGDPSQLHQVVMNLCTNAFSAMKDSGGVLKVSLEPFEVEAKFAKGQSGIRRNYNKLRISDTGAGIDPETLERIFEPFFTTREVGEGTGMGLATVHGIIASHGGEIFVDSKPGEGTSFDIYLPQTTFQARGDASEDASIPEGSERILFVDDEEEIAILGKQMLERAGYTVTTDTDSQNALEMFKKRPKDFDLVVTDQAMPKLYGVKLAEEILKIRADIPIILISGFADTITTESVQKMGISDFVMKPLVGRELGRAIRQALDGA